MATLDNRDDLETGFARSIARTHARIARELIARIGDEPDYIPDAAWESIRDALIQTIDPHLEGIYTAGAEALTQEVGIAVEQMIINQNAATWARQYGYELVSGMNARSRTLLQQTIADYFEQRLTLRDVQNRIHQTFGPRRAAQIAITETTRAAVEGDKGAVHELEAQGIHLRTLFLTVRDGVVCPICSGADKRDVKEVGYPPLHVGCRCSTRSEVITSDG